MFQKHIDKAKFYPSADDFTQALLVMLVTNIMSDVKLLTYDDWSRLCKFISTVMDVTMMWPVDFTMAVTSDLDKLPLPLTCQRFVM